MRNNCVFSNFSSVEASGGDIPERYRSNLAADKFVHYREVKAATCREAAHRSGRTVRPLVFRSNRLAKGLTDHKRTELSAHQNTHICAESDQPEARQRGEARKGSLSRETRRRSP